jgi:hypothetical protein
VHQFHGPKNWFSVSSHRGNGTENLRNGTENWFLRPVNQYSGSENYFRGSMHPGNGTKNLCDVRWNLLQATRNQAPERGSPE